MTAGSKTAELVRSEKVGSPQQTLEVSRKILYSGGGVLKVQMLISQSSGDEAVQDQHAGQFSSFVFMF